MKARGSRRDDGSRTHEIVATGAGRRGEVTTGRQVVEVAEATRTGEPVRTATDSWQARVVALVEHPPGEALATRAQSGIRARRVLSEAAQPRSVVSSESWSGDGSAGSLV